MALTTPILLAKNAFDATKEEKFEFNVISGDQVVASTLIIKDNETLSQVYSGRQVTFTFENIVPAGTLTNGKYYQAYLITENKNGEKSPQSNTIQFYCYTQPTFVFSNIPSSAIIDNASYSFEVTYNQAESENLDSYVFNLYTFSKTLLSTSGNQYNSSSTLPLVINHLFAGLDNNTEYYVECNGVTSGGTRITTGLVRIFVQYTQPAFYSNLILTNHCQGGYITVQAHVVGIEGKSNPSPPTYIEDKEVDLRKPGTYVKWEEGYEIQGDFTLRAWFRGAWNEASKTLNTLKNEAFDYLTKVGSEQVEMLNLTNDNNVIYSGIIYERVSDTAVKVYGYVRVLQNKNDVHGYNIYSTPLTLSASTFMDENLMLMIKRIGNLYEAFLVEGGN